MSDFSAANSSQPGPTDAEAARLRSLYLEIVKKSVGDFLYDFDRKFTQNKQTGFSWVDLRTGRKHQITDYDELKENGLIGSNVVHTLIGLKRLNQLQEAVETVLREKIPGDLIETGVLRGGACIFMRAILEAYGIRDRKVWVADSFKGFPSRSPKPGQIDAESFNRWSATRAEVEENFRRYGLLDDQVEFLEGWFSDTLPAAPIAQLAVLRLDGDIYPSTIQALEALYPRLAPGGYLIVDDYYAFDECREAVREYRAAQGITTPIERVDPVCVYWRKSGSV